MGSIENVTEALKNFISETADVDSHNALADRCSSLACELKIAKGALAELDRQTQQKYSALAREVEDMGSVLAELCAGGKKTGGASDVKQLAVAVDMLDRKVDEMGMRIHDLKHVLPSAKKMGGEAAARNRGRGAPPRLAVEDAEIVIPAAYRNDLQQSLLFVANGAEVYDSFVEYLREGGDITELEYETQLMHVTKDRFAELCAESVHIYAQAWRVRDVLNGKQRGTDPYWTAGGGK